MSSQSPPLIPASTPFTLDLATILSLGLVFSFLPISQLLASYAIPSSTSTTPTTTLEKKRRSNHYYLFVWCSFDFLTHTIVEGSYLYHCFFSSIPRPNFSSGTNSGVVSDDYPHPASRGTHSSLLSSSGVVHQGPFLNDPTRLYGSFFADASAPMARLWREYAKADKRWGGSDTTVISLELLTVGLAGPAALYICFLISSLYRTTTATSTRDPSKNTNVKAIAKTKGKLEAKIWFVAIALSTAELYGGFMTFAPEWLSGNAALVGPNEDAIVFWLYLVFFNMIWVFVPAWVMWVGFGEVVRAFEGDSISSGSGREDERKKGI